MRVTQYILPVLIGSIVMMGLSYLWHGVFLNDFKIIDVADIYFYSFLAVFYLCLSTAFTFLFRHLSEKLHTPFMRFTLGAISGFLLYLFAHLMGVTFQGNDEVKHLVVDFSWQMFEQGFGAFVIGSVVLVAKNVFSMQD